MQDYWNSYWNRIDAKRGQLSIGRTKFGVPIPPEIFEKEVHDIMDYLELKKKDTVLDLCAGNGLISEAIYESVNKVIAVDYSKPLLDSFVVSSDKIRLVHSDLNDFDFQKITFNKVILYFAIQHFDLSSTAILISKALAGLNRGGIMLIGDIPNIDMKWKFYSKLEYRKFYFEKLIKNEQHIGTWFQKDFFSSLLTYLGYEGRYHIKEKPDYHYNSGVRFDLLIRK